MTVAVDGVLFAMPGIGWLVHGHLYRPLFTWLVTAIEDSCRLDYAGATGLASIQATLDHSLGIMMTKPTFNRARMALRRGREGLEEPTIMASLQTDWDPLHFIEQQGFKGPDCLPGVLTLSGTANNIQMLPCRQYLRQTWPFAGEIVLEALVDWIKATSSASWANLPSITSRSTLATHGDVVDPSKKRH